MNKMKHILRILMALTATTLLFGCESTNEDDAPYLSELKELIIQNKSKWVSAGISTYMYTYSKTPSDCGIVSPLPPVVVSVVNGEVSSAYIPAFGVYESSITSYLTIKGVFNSMLQELNENPSVFSKSSSEQNQPPEFNTQYGYPTRYYVDKSIAECDAYNVGITELQ